MRQREIVVLDPHGVEVHPPRDDLRRPSGASVGKPTNGRLVVAYDGQSYLVTQPVA